MCSREIKVKIKRLRDSAKIPEYKTAGAAGMDVCYAGNCDIVIKKGCIERIPTGIAFEIPNSDMVMLLYARSGLSLKGISMANGVGVIDSDYRGEIICPMINMGEKDFTIAPGDRIGQIVFTPVIHPVLEQTDELGKTERNKSGFGSTGIN